LARGGVLGRMQVEAPDYCGLLSTLCFLLPAFGAPATLFDK
jgi:hypothetical protein